MTHQALLERVAQLEAALVQERAMRVRAFAQGFTAAMEDAHAEEWTEYYRERQG